MNGVTAKLIPCEDTKNKISLILKMFNVENYISSHDLHVTIIYSRKECPELKETSVGLPIVATGKSFDIFTSADGSKCLVLELESDILQNIHDRFREEHGCTHDFDSYRPHITLSYDYSSNEVPGEAMLEHFWSLKFDEFVVEPLNWDKI